MAALFAFVSTCVKYYRVILITCVLGLIAALAVSRHELKVAHVELQAKTAQIAQLTADIKDITETRNLYSQTVTNLSEEKRKLTDKLERRGKKSIGEIAKKKPKLVQKLVNRGTENVLKCIEEVSRGGKC